MALRFEGTSVEAVNYDKPFMVRDDDSFADNRGGLWGNGYTSCDSHGNAEELPGRDNIGKRKWYDAVFNYEILAFHESYAFYNKIVVCRGNGVLSVGRLLACID